MAGKNLDYWYDEQIKRYLIQIIRVFSHFQVKENTSNGAFYNRVPCRYADASRLVTHLLRNNSENTINNAPQITVGVQSLQVARDRTQEPYLVDTKQVAEREFNKESGQYTSEQGNLYTTQRYMPVPYNLTVQVDIWTTNTDTKLQLLEQIMVLFNPSIQLQSNNNPLDWTSVFEIELTDLNWSSRTLPQGVDEQLDIATLTFAVPIWISPPAKVKRQSIIQRIVTDIYNVKSVDELGLNADYYDFFGSLPDDAEIIVTPGDFYVSVNGASVTIEDNAGNPKVWKDLIEMQGEISSASKLKLNTSSDSDDQLAMLTGTISYNPLSDSQLIFNLDTDTLPSDTLASVNKIIDPRANYPGDGTLAAADEGQRYLITEDLDSEGWPNWAVDAKANDIIEYVSGAWIVSFSASSSTTVEYVTNNYTSKQFKWSDDMWTSTYEGTYRPGFWSLVL